MTDYAPYETANTSALAFFGVELHDVEFVPWAIYTRSRHTPPDWLAGCHKTANLPRYRDQDNPFPVGGLYSSRFWMLIVERCVWIIDQLHGQWWLDTMSASSINSLFRFERSDDEVLFRLAFTGDKSRLDR